VEVEVEVEVKQLAPILGIFDRLTCGSRGSFLHCDDITRTAQSPSFFGCRSL
jgi:hypothetical protein